MQVRSVSRDAELCLWMQVRGVSRDTEALPARMQVRGVSRDAEALPEIKFIKWMSIFEFHFNAASAASGS